MRAALAVAALALALGLAACNANPLLRAAASDYAPLRVGSRWEYRSPDGATTLSREVTARGSFAGRDAYTVATRVDSGPAVESHLAFEQGDLLRHDAALGWVLERRLPLVSGNRWPLDTGDPLVTSIRVVDGLEDLEGPLGAYKACFRLRTRTESFDPGSGLTSTAESLAWAAPGIGDVRYAVIGQDGAVSTTLELVGVSLP